MNKEQKFEAALRKIANFKENIEDYYGGVSINYNAMLDDIIKIATDTFNENRTPCEIREGCCCEPCLETAYKFSADEFLKKSTK